MLQFPTYVYTQPHPCVNAFNKIQELNSMLEAFNTELSQGNKPILTEETFNALSKFKDRQQVIDANQIENYCIKQLFLKKMQALLSDYPQGSDTYIRALRYVEQNVLHQKLTSKNIVNIAKEINKILIPDGGGVFRTSTAIVYDDRIMPKIKNKETFLTLDKFFEKDKEIYQVWKAQTRAKIWKRNFAAKPNYVPFDEKDVKCIEIMAEIISPNVIQSGMKELQAAFIHKTDDCYEFAGSLHQIFVKAHPFNDGNGSTARIIMYIVFMQAGNAPLLIDNDEKYTAAVKSDDFVGYIRGLAEKQPVCDRLVSAAMRTIFDATK